VDSHKVRQIVDAELAVLKETRDRLSHELAKLSAEVALLAEEGFEVARKQIPQDVLLPLVESLAAYWITDSAAKNREEELRILEQNPLFPGKDALA
jgi:hypothetical protein